MRELTVKWTTACKRCGASLNVGAQAMYEKSMGLFCIGHEPKEIEEIRSFRLAKAEKKAERYEEWAEKREEKATAALNSFPEIRHDWAFITQPGHIPFRARMNAADERACESLKIADGMRSRADGIRNVKVAGDAEARRQAVRDKLDLIIHKGSRVRSIIFGDGVVVGIYAKSYRIKYDRGFTHSEEKSFIIPLKDIVNP